MTPDDETTGPLDPETGDPKDGAASSGTDAARGNVTPNADRGKPADEETQQGNDPGTTPPAW